MGDLKDQLLKAGLVTEEQLSEASKPKSRPRPKKRKSGGKQGNRPRGKPRVETKPASKAEMDLAEAYRIRAREERRAEEEAAHARREAERRRKANRARIAELIREHAQKDDRAELPYHFAVGGKVKQVYVTDAQLKALATGALAITFLEGRRCLIPTGVADQIQTLDPNKMIVRHDPTADQDGEDDIPDDLMW